MSRVPLVLLALPVMAMILLAAIGYVPTARSDGQAGLEAMAIALALVAGAVYATMLRAMRRMSIAADTTQRFKAAFRAGMERFLITLALAGAIAWRGKIDARAFLVWVAISYVVMIKVETLILIRWSRTLENRT